MSYFKTAKTYKEILPDGNSIDTEAAHFYVQNLLYFSHVLMKNFSASSTSD